MSDNSLGFAFQQHLKVLTDVELYEFHIQYFNRLSKGAGAAAVMRDVHRAHLWREQQMRRLQTQQQQAQLPLPTSSFAPQLTIDSVPNPPASLQAPVDLHLHADAHPQVLQPSAGASSSSAGIQARVQLHLPAAASNAIQLKVPGMQQEAREEWSALWAARAQLKELQSKDF